jgi:hypothetical protein
MNPHPSKQLGTLSFGNKGKTKQYIKLKNT